MSHHSNSNNTHVEFISNRGRRETRKDLERIRIIIISDTHNLHHHYLEKEEEFPSGDILLHAGDFSNFGLPHEALHFNRFLRRVKEKFKAIFVVPGNHENYCDVIVPLVTHCTKFLRNDGAAFSSQQKEIQLYGTRFKPFWSLPLMRDSLAQHSFHHIPLGTQIILSHQPMFDILDQHGKHVGNKELRKRVEEVKPDVFICGHNHEEGRKTQILEVENGHQILCINAAMYLEDDTLASPIVLDYFL